jgi:hypothetical protein
MTVPAKDLVAAGTLIYSDHPAEVVRNALRQSTT